MQHGQLPATCVTPLPPCYDVVLPKDRLARHCHEEILEAVPGGDFGAVTSRLRRWTDIAIQGIIKAGMRLLLEAEFCWMGIPVIRVPWSMKIKRSHCGNEFICDEV